MELVLSEKEKVYYNRDYCKGKSNITITDKRLISTVKSKKETTRKEFLVDDICSVNMKFRPISIISFVFGSIFSICALSLKLFEFTIKTKEETTEFNQLSMIFTSIAVTLIVFAIFNFIIGLLSLRNGYHVVIKSKQCGYIGVTSLSAKLGKVKPIKLRPSKKDALELMNDIPSALALIKYETSKK